MVLSEWLIHFRKPSHFLYYMKKSFFSKCQPIMLQLKICLSLETDLVLLSIYSFGVSVKASKFFSLVSEVNKVLTMFWGFPSRVKIFKHFVSFDLEIFHGKNNLSLPGRNLYQRKGKKKKKRKRIWWECLLSLSLTDIMMNAATEMLSFYRGKCNRNHYF